MPSHFAADPPLLPWLLPERDRPDIAQFDGFSLRVPQAHPA
jgi:hypothetical protein